MAIAAADEAMNLIYQRNIFVFSAMFLKLFKFSDLLVKEKFNKDEKDA